MNIGNIVKPQKKHVLINKGTPNLFRKITPEEKEEFLKHTMDFYGEMMDEETDEELVPVYIERKL